MRLNDTNILASTPCLYLICPGSWPQPQPHIQRRSPISFKMAIREQFGLIKKNQVHFGLGSFLQGQIQGQTTGNALAPKLTVRLRQEWSQTIPRPNI